MTGSLNPNSAVSNSRPSTASGAVADERSTSLAAERMTDDQSPTCPNSQNPMFFVPGPPLSPDAKAYTSPCGSVLGRMFKKLLGAGSGVRGELLGSPRAMDPCQLESKEYDTMCIGVAQGIDSWQVLQEEYQPREPWHVHVAGEASRVLVLGMLDTRSTAMRRAGNTGGLDSVHLHAFRHVLTVCLPSTGILDAVGATATSKAANISVARCYQSIIDVVSLPPWYDQASKDVNVSYGTSYVGGMLREATDRVAEAARYPCRPAVRMDVARTIHLST
ncbi:hypothetical protein BDU57DRAFT_591542 [Ampelomyces quisqualis]|uniref:Uncharacterized protein n=1 Tax=Ampelomyces quisqualis TaxID=50730 RepID=A0A6A5QZX6_AMPQU|nr:hypothetical protein BDU57DRAFT_591542 [Ampelomyces quisqualis]